METEKSRFLIAGKVWNADNENTAYRRELLKRLSNIGTSPTRAIKVFCWQCSGFSHAEVRACECRDCPLFVLKWNRNKRKAERKNLENKGVAE